MTKRIKPFVLRIEEPCHAAWDNMPMVEGGRFCHSCQKAVTDFRFKNKAETEAFLTSNPDTCGLFFEDQLQITYFQADSISRLHLRAYMLACALGMLTIGLPTRGHAWQPIKAEIPQIKKADLTQTYGLDKAAQIPDTTKTWMVTGSVVTKTNHYALQNVQISVKGYSISAFTDEKGTYKLYLPKDITTKKLEITYRLTDYFDARYRVSITGNTIKDIKLWKKDVNLNIDLGSNRRTYMGKPRFRKLKFPSVF